MKRFLFLLFFYLSLNVNASHLGIIIADMQPEFTGSTSTDDIRIVRQMISKQIELIHWAISNNLPILVFEYEEAGETLKELMVHISKHTHAVVLKQTDGGFEPPSGDIAKSIFAKWNVSKLIISGVNGQYCIKSTTLGAIQENFEVITAVDLVGHFAPLGYIYPDKTWFQDINSSQFTIYPTLQELIDDTVQIPLAVNQN